MTENICFVEMREYILGINEGKVNGGRCHKLGRWEKQEHGICCCIGEQAGSRTQANGKKERENFTHVCHAMVRSCLCPMPFRKSSQNQLCKNAKLLYFMQKEGRHACHMHHAKA